MSVWRHSLPPLPDRIKRLPVDIRGYPVPWFAAWVDGKPDFRVADHNKLIQAVHWRRCWVCGGPLGSYKAFVIGPMCCINRVSAEPPCHRECAEFSAQACPFLIKPQMRRRDNDLPEGHRDARGIPLMRNPGVALVWVTRKYTLLKVDDGFLFNIGEPVEALWFKEGRPATRQEVMAAITAGLPALEDLAQQEGADAVAELERMTLDAEAFMPVESAV